MNQKKNEVNGRRQWSNRLMRRQVGAEMMTPLRTTTNGTYDTYETLRKYVTLSTGRGCTTTPQIPTPESERSLNELLGPVEH